MELDPQTTTVPKNANRDKEQVTLAQAKVLASREIKTMRKVRRIMSKFLLSKLTPQKLSKESWLVQTLQEAMKTQPLQLNCCQVRFENTQEAAEANSKLLQDCDNDFEVLTSKEQNTVITPGLEF